MNSGNDMGKLIMRTVLGALILFHGISKIISGPASVLGLMTKVGMPEALGYLVYLGEVAAPALLILGLWSRAAALVIAVNMVIAVLLVHTSQIFTLAKSGGWALELQGMYFFAALAIVFLGAGRYSIGGASGRWN